MKHPASRCNRGFSSLRQILWRLRRGRCARRGRLRRSGHTRICRSGIRFLQRHSTRVHLRSLLHWRASSRRRRRRRSRNCRLRRTGRCRCGHRRRAGNCGLRRIAWRRRLHLTTSRCRYRHRAQRWHLRASRLVRSRNWRGRRDLCSRRRRSGRSWRSQLFDHNSTWRRRGRRRSRGYCLGSRLAGFLLRCN